MLYGWNHLEYYATLALTFQLDENLFLNYSLAIFELCLLTIKLAVRQRATLPGSPDKRLV